MNFEALTQYVIKFDKMIVILRQSIVINVKIENELSNVDIDLKINDQFGFLI